ncbi:TIGR03747 family integrating conjugative element membrane protein [Klebsiella oxytoca]|uniref:TIGR03747 family integrating conjugative element membrane protein n=1 Tax=Klebsiella oxytoca TaxID=571 RepID=UPI00384BFC12
MAERRETPPPQQPVKEPGPVSYLLWHLPWKLLGLFLCSVLFSIVLEFIGLTFFWPDEGWQHSQQVLLTELGWFSRDFHEGVSSLLDLAPVGVVSETLATVHDWLMVKSGLQAWLTDGSQDSAGLLQRTGSGMAGLLREYLQAAVNVTLVCFLRVLILLFTLPFFFLVAVAASTEGWMRRELRRFGAAYESSFIYHYARRSIRPLFWLPWGIYLNLPCAVWPPVVLLPAAAMLGCAIMVTVATFKKYL